MCSEHWFRFSYNLSTVQDKLRFDPESEIATTGLRVSLICPVSPSTEIYKPDMFRSKEFKMHNVLMHHPVPLSRPSWWRCGSVYRAEFWLVPIFSVSTQSSSSRWMRISPHGLAPSVTNLPHLSCSQSMGKRRALTRPASATQSHFLAFFWGFFVISYNHVLKPAYIFFIKTAQMPSELFINHTPNYYSFILKGLNGMLRVLLQL